MDKAKADMIQIVIVAIAIMTVFVGLAWASAWRSVEGDRLNARARMGIECSVSGAEWLGSEYSMTITCRLPSGRE